MNRHISGSVILLGLCLASYAQSGGGYYYTAQNFPYSLNAGDAIVASITPASTADWDMRLKDPANNTVRSSVNGTGATDSVSYTAPVTGTYTVQVYFYSGSGGYNYSYTIYRASSGQQTTSGGTISNLSPGVTYTYNTPYTFQHYVPSGYSISVLVSMDYSVNYDVRLRNPSGSTVATSQRGAGSTDSITYAAGSNGGYYYVDVYWVSGGGSYYYMFNTAATGPTPSTGGGSSSTLSNQYFTWQSGYVNRWDGTYCQYSVNLTAGVAFTATTSNASGYNDTFLYLLNSSGTIVASNDDYNGTLYSRISFTPSYSGTYTLRLRAYGQGQSGYCTLSMSGQQ